MYSVQPTKAYRKSLKRLVRSGNFDILEVDRLINTLVSRAVLDPKYDNHPLHGEYAGCFECHLKGNWLLIYELDETENTLTIVDIGSHSDLFG